MTASAEDRITTLADRYVPVFQIYFARETVQPTPGASNPPIDMDTARTAEIARIQGRISSGLLKPLAGPYGPNPNQQTNDVKSLRYTDRINGNLAEVSIELHNVYDNVGKTYRYTDPPPGQANPLIDYGVTIAVLFGYGVADPQFEGMITTISVSFPGEDASVVTITAVDKRDRLRSQKGLQLKPFKKLSEEEIAAQVASQMGLSLAIRSGQQTIPKGKVTISQDQDAYQFMADRASKASLELSCMGNTIFLLTPGDVTPGVSALGYTYRQGLTSFTPELDGNGKPSSVMVTARDPHTQKTYTGQATPQALQAAGVVPAGTTVADKIMMNGQGGNRQEVVTDYQAASDEEAKNIAMGILKKNMDNMLTASGELIGDPEVRAGVTLQIQGVGIFGGQWYVTESTHTFGNGYTTSFRARRNSAPAPSGSGQ
jgi:uncharacterized protein